ERLRRVEHDFAGSTWQPRTVEAWRVTPDLVRRSVTERTGARTTWDAGDLQGSLEFTWSGVERELALRSIANAGTSSEVLVEIATDPDPRPGLGDYLRVARIVRAGATQTEVVATRTT